MKLSIVFLLGLFVFVSSAYAQKITAIQGKAFSAPVAKDIILTGGTTEPDLLPLADGRILVLKRGKWLTSASPRQSWLYICDKSMNEVQKETKADLPKGYEGYSLFTFNGKYYLVGTSENKDRKLTKAEKEYEFFMYFKLSLFEINLTNLSISNSNILNDADFNTQSNQSKWALFVSPDNKRFTLIGSELVVGELEKVSKTETKITATTKIHVYWFDKNLKQEKHQTYSTLTTSIHKDMPGFLSNEGKLFIQATRTTGKGTGDHVIVSFDPGQSDFTVVVELQSALKSGLVFTGISSAFTEDYFITAGLSFNSSTLAYDGYVYRRFSLKDRTDEVMQTIPVDKMLIDAVNKTKQKSKDYSKAFADLQKGGAQFAWGGNRKLISDNTQVIIHDDMSATLITEIAATRVVGSDANFVHYINFDVIVTRIDPAGTVAWTKRVPVWQDLDVLVGEYNGVFTAYHEGNLYLFHNRCSGTGKKNEDNICELDKGNLSNADIVCTAIDPAGKVSTQTVYNNKGYGEMFAPRNSMQLSNGRIILYSFDGGKQRLVEVMVK